MIGLFFSFVHSAFNTREKWSFIFTCNNLSQSGGTRITVLLKNVSYDSASVIQRLQKGANLTLTLTLSGTCLPEKFGWMFIQER